MDRLKGLIFGLSAAVLFGASAPLAKLLLRDVEPLMLSALLYCGAAFAVLVMMPIRPGGRREAPVRKSDIPLLLMIILAGGMIGPVSMLLGLQRLSGVSGSLLLNLEAPFTILIALFFFREHLHRNEALAVGLIVFGGALLSLEGGDFRVSIIGVLMVAGACVAWGLDNNWTQRLTLRDPFAIVAIKAGGAGLSMFAIALASGQLLPRPGLAAAALALGAASYGVSILLDAYALRILGAAREAAIFATAPFIGALLAPPILGETFAPLDLAAGAFMVMGVTLLIRARHEHFHTHDELEHEHVHVHDEHHQHEHASDVEPAEPHSHPHTHVPITHAHPHVSDAHHRHEH